jgi:hypothetical protein
MRPILEGAGTWERTYAWGGFSIRGRYPNFWTMVIGNGWCMNVGGEEDDLPELFDLSEDPGQQVNVYEQNTEIAQEMGKAYVAFLESVGTDPGKVALMAKKFG